MTDEQEALELFRAIADRDCWVASIGRSKCKWWIQFIAYDGTKTMPVIDDDLHLAINRAITVFSPIAPGKSQKVRDTKILPSEKISVDADEFSELMSIAMSAARYTNFARDVGNNRIREIDATLFQLRNQVSRYLEKFQDV